MTKEMVCKKVLGYREEGYKFGEIASMIADEAISQGCPDNISVIIIDLESYYNRFNRFSNDN